jgi:Tol biopolymer transport system component
MKYANRYLSPVLAFVAFLLAAGTPASATYPGKNGRIAFIAGPDVYTMNPDGSDVRQLTNLGPDNNEAFWESWSPDGKYIVFNEYRAPDYLGQLWLMNADGTNQHLLLAENDFTDERPSFAPDGSEVVFNRCRVDIEACGIYQIGLAGGTPAAKTNIDLGIQDVSPQYSVRDRLIFASTSRRGIICAIYLDSRDGNEPKQLTPAALSARQPDWSPDGNRIAVSSHCGNPQNEEIWILDVDRDAIRQLTNNGNDYLAGPHDFHPSWSPQGDEIVFQREAPDFSSSAIYIMKHDGTACRKLFSLPNSSVSKSSRANHIRGHLRRAVTNGTAIQIETGGARPQWGVAPE